MVNRISFCQSFQRRCLQSGIVVAILLSTVSITACDQQEESDPTSLRSDQVEILDQTAVAHSCATQYDNWEAPTCEEELSTCSEQAIQQKPDKSEDKKKNGKPKWIRRLIKRAIKSCRPEFRECIDQGGDKATCKQEFRTCVKEFIHEHFDEMCDKLLDRCENADPRPKVCDRIEKKCEQDLNEDD